MIERWADVLRGVLILKKSGFKNTFAKTDTSLGF
jgi:hypothetical protein